MDDCTLVMWPSRNPDIYRITKLNDMRVDIIHDIDKYSHCIDNLLEYWLQKEADYIKNTILKDLWRHEADLHKFICDANPDLMPVPESEDNKDSSVTCPECWWSGDKQPTCPDCGYEFNSDNKEEDA